MGKVKLLNKRPILFITLAFVFGIILSAFLYQNEVMLFGLFGTSFVVSLLLFSKKRKKLGMLVIVFMLGILAFNIEYILTKPKEYEGSAYVSGRVIAVSNVNELYHYELTDVKLCDEKSRKNVCLLTKYQLEVGDIVVSHGEVETLSYQPFDTYSIAFYDVNSGYIFRAETVSVISSGNLSILEWLSNSVKEGLREGIGGEEGEFAAALMFGDSALLDRGIKDSFKISGLAHLFSVSGLHVAFLAAVIFFVCKKLRLRQEISFVVTLFILFIYGVITGLPASCIRASLMLMIMLLGQMLFKRYDPLSALSLSALMILIVKPMMLFELGFQMSFSAMLGIFCFYDKIRTKLYSGKNKVIHYLVSFVSMSLSANIFLIAIVLNTFSWFGMYFVLGNVIILPFISVIFTLILAIGFMNVIFPFLSVLYAPIKIIISSCFELAYYVATLPYSSVKVNSTGIFSLIYILLIITLSKFVIMEKKNKYIAALTAIGVSVILLVTVG